VRACVGEKRGWRKVGATVLLAQQADLGVLEAAEADRWF
jgi:hypothetical protein